MHIPLIPPRGGSLSVASHVGPNGSIVVNTDAKTIHVHDGITAGGFALAKVGHQHSQNEITAALGFTPVSTAVIGQAGGVASLQANGLIPVAQLGSGTANATKVLYGDGSWKDAPTGGGGGSSDSLVGTGAVAPSAAASGVYAGRNGTVGELYLINSTAGSNEKAVQFSQNNDGSLQINLFNDLLSSSLNFFSLDRNGANANIATFNVNSMVVNGTLAANSYAGVGTALTALNASNLASGTVPSARLGGGTADATTYLRGDGTWAPVSAGVATSLNGTGPRGFSIATSAVTAGVSNDGSYNVPCIGLVSANAGLNQKVWQIGSTTGGGFEIGGYSDALSGGSFTSYFSISRSGMTAAAITLAATAINLNGAVTGTSFSGIGTNLTALNATNLSSGTVATARLGSGTADNSTFLRGDGTWATPAAGGTFLNATGTSTPVATVSGVYVGSGSIPAITYVNAQSAAGNRVYETRVDNAGNFQINMVNDGLNSNPTVFQIDRTGTTAAVVSLTGTSIALNGAVTGTSFSGVGTALTALNASNLSSGTVATARLGSGTADANSYLRGDGTWATVVAAAPTTLNATGSRALSMAVAAVVAGVSTDGTYNVPCLNLIAANAPANAKSWQFSATNGGGFELGGYNDAGAGGSYTTYFTVARSGTAASSLTLAATAINLNGAVTGTSFTGAGTGLTALNAGNLASGTVPAARLGSGTADATTYLRGDGTWTTVAAAATSLGATSTVARSGTVNGIYIGLIPTLLDPIVTLTNSAAAADNRVMQLTQDDSGAFQFQLYNDALNTFTNAMTFSRSGTTSTNIKLNANSVNLAGLTTGLQLNGSAGTAGQVLTSQGPSAAPTWTTPSGGGGGWPVTSAFVWPGVSAAGLFGGSSNGNANLCFISTTGAVDNKAFSITGNSTGMTMGFGNDASSQGSNFMSVTRSGITPTNVTLTGTAITLTGAVTGTSFSGVGTALTALNASNLTSGTVATARLGTGTADNTTFLRGDGTWASATASSSTSLNGTGAPSGRSSSTSGVFAGTIGYPLITMSAAGAGTNAKSAQIYLDSTTGAFGMSFLPDGLASQNLFFTASRSGATAATITMTSTAMNLAVGTGGLQLNGVAGTAGQVLTSNGPSAAPTWAAPVPPVLAATGNHATVLTSGVYAGLRSNAAALQLVNTSCVAEAQVTSLVHDNDGVVRLRMWANNFASNNYAFEVTRNGASTPSMFKLYGTAINLAVGTDGLQLNGVAGTAGQVLTSNGAGVAPTWSAPTAAPALNGTGAFTFSAAANATLAGQGVITLVNASASAANNRVWQFDVASANTFRAILANDANNAWSSNWLSATRSGNTVTNISLAATAITLSGNVAPAADNTSNLGTASLRWANGYFGALFTTSGTVSVSDERLKTDIIDLEDAEVRVAQQLKQLLKKYRLKSEVAAQGTKAKWHVGIMAQAVVKAFADEGLDAHDYAMLSLTDVDGVDQYGVNYDELLAFIIAAL